MNETRVNKKAEQPITPTPAGKCNNTRRTAGYASAVAKAKKKSHQTTSHTRKRAVGEME
jgi:hypothetical protein